MGYGFAGPYSNAFGSQTPDPTAQQGQGKVLGMDPTTAMLLAGLIQGVGGYFGGRAQANASTQGTAEQAREFDIMQGRKAKYDPLRDRLTYYLTQRMGLPTQQAQWHDPFNNENGPAQTYGYDQNALNDAMAKYQPGMGGITSGPESKSPISDSTGFSPTPDWKKIFQEHPEGRFASYDQRTSDLLRRILMGQGG